MIDKKTEEYYDNLLARLKAKDPVFEQRQEFGKMLFRHIDDLAPSERARYEELKTFLKDYPL